MKMPRCGCRVPGMCESISVHSPRMTKSATAELSPFADSLNGHRRMRAILTRWIQDRDRSGSSVGVSGASSSSPWSASLSGFGPLGNACHNGRASEILIQGMATPPCRPRHRVAEAQTGSSGYFGVATAGMAGASLAGNESADIVSMASSSDSTEHQSRSSAAGQASRTAVTQEAGGRCTPGPTWRPRSVRPADAPSKTPRARLRRRSGPASTGPSSTRDPFSSTPMVRALG